MPAKICYLLYSTSSVKVNLQSDYVARLESCFTEKIKELLWLSGQHASSPSLNLAEVKYLNGD